MKAKARSFLTLGLLALSCGGGGGAAKEIPQAEACPEATKAVCTKVFSCDDAILNIAKASLLGGSQANCLATLQQPPYCDSFSCQAGQTYHGDKAAACKDQFAGVKCEDITAAIIAGGTSSDIPSLVRRLAPACGEVCTGGSSDAGADR